MKAGFGELSQLSIGYLNKKETCTHPTEYNANV